MGIHDDILAISAKFDLAVASALELEVADAGKRKMQDILDAEVYEGYTPQPFFMDTRRGENGGLKDDRNMASWVENGDTLMIQNDTEAQSLWESQTRNLDVIVEEGLLDYGKTAGKHDFYGDTESAMIADGDVERALLAGLQRQGY